MGVPNLWVLGFEISNLNFWLDNNGNYDYGERNILIHNNDQCLPLRAVAPDSSNFISPSPHSSGHDITQSSAFANYIATCFT